MKKTKSPEAAGTETTLDALRPGERGTVGAIAECPARERLLDLGMTPGAAVSVCRRAPFGDPLEIRLRDSRLILRRAEAAAIRVVRDSLAAIR